MPTTRFSVQLSTSLQSLALLHFCPALAVRPILKFHLVLLPLPEALLGRQPVVVVVELVPEFPADHLMAGLELMPSKSR